MRALASIALFALASRPLPWLTGSGLVLNLATMILMLATLGQAWNLLGGMAGQFSFGHAAFFGTGAYATAILQIRFGLDAWTGLVAAVAAAGAMGALVGFASFRFRLRGSYFALVTLAFAEVARILANSLEVTGAGVGLLLPLAPGFARLQFTDKAGYYWFALGLCTSGLLLAARLRDSRLGAQLAAVRENEEAARALGVDAFAVKMRAIVLSAGLSGAVGAFYTQLFLYLDPHIAFGPQVSVEALLAPIVGGTGSLWGPFLGAALLQLLGEASRAVTGGLTGANLVVYGIVLVLVVRFFPDGLIGLGRPRPREASGVTG
jgi:branched-chain amino acid transport system permease protein